MTRPAVPARTRRARVLRARKATRRAFAVANRAHRTAAADPARPGVWFVAGFRDADARAAEAAEATAATAPRRDPATPPGFGRRAGRGEFARSR